MLASGTRSIFCAVLVAGLIGPPRTDAGSALPATNDFSFRQIATAARTGLATNPPPKIRRGLKALETLATAALTSPVPAERSAYCRQIAEVSAAIQNNNRSPVPQSIDLLQLPFVHYRYISGRVGTGFLPAANLRAPDGAQDLSQIDPLSSTFWRPPQNIATQDLAVGFGRAARPNFEEPVWEYVAAKNGFGAHAGFEARHGSTRIKIKFGELHSEPFTARIFHALGYHVDATDYSPGLTVKYDPRIFSDFNTRKALNTKISAAGLLPVWTIQFQPEHDPFACIAMTVFKDGTTLDGRALKETLLTATAEARSSLESRIHYVVTTPANVQIKNPDEENIGPWDFGQLGHEHLRELRGAGLLAAWLGWFDSRFENTRLRVVRSGHRIELKHVFSDLGGGLGKSVGWSGWQGESAAEFPDTFTEPEIVQGKGRMTIPFRVVNFRPIENTPAFKAMTIDDARWMARMIKQLSEEQIAAALRASGFDEVNVETFCSKLLSRQEKMLKDLSRGGQPF